MGELDKLLDTAEVAAMLGVATRTLEFWRYTRPNRGPKYVAISRRCVRYRYGDVLAYLQRLTVGTSTDEIHVEG
jgi:predicted DNA-binding transcriptional regulator AlpA